MNQPVERDTRDCDVTLGGRQCIQLPCPYFDSPGSSGSIRNFHREPFECELDLAEAGVDQA